MRCQQLLIACLTLPCVDAASAQRPGEQQATQEEGAETSAAKQEARAQKPADQKAFFGLDKLWRIDLRVSDAAWESMYPKQRLRMGLSMRGQFEYAKADVRIAGHEIKGVGLRFKGNSTFWTTGTTLKRPLKIDFDRYVEKQRFLGLRKLNLQNNATDPTQLREAVSYKAYRDAGVPASRTCFARVYLTIPGRLDGEYLGLYTIAEQVDRDFLRRNFGSRKGMIVKPEGQALAYLGEQWDELYDKIYIPKTSVDHELAARFIGFARLAEEATDDAGRKRLAAQLSEFLDVDEFLRYTAVTTLLVNLDSPFTIPHNFYMAVPAKTKRVLWIPWDLNLSLGGFRMMGGARANTSVQPPSRVAAIASIFALPEIQARYKQICTELIDGPCSGKALLASIETASKTIAGALADEWKRSEAVTKAPLRGGLGGRGAVTMGRPRSQRSEARALETAKAFVVSREKNVRDQLSGKTPKRTARGWLSGRGRATPGTAVAGFFVRIGLLDLEQRSELTEEDLAIAIDTCFAGVDANSSGALQRKEVEGEAKRQPSRGFNFMARAGNREVAARRLWLRLDADRDGSVTKAEWRKAVRKAFDGADRDKSGTWSRSELRRFR